MNQRNLAGKRGSLRHSTTSFSANVEGKALDNIDLNQMSHRYVSGVSTSAHLIDRCENVNLSLKRVNF